MNSISIRYGLLAGMIMISLMILLYMLSPGSLASMWSIVFYMPLIFLMIFGGITYRKEMGGEIDLKQAFVAVMLISVIATVMFDTFGYLLYSVIDPGLVEIIKEQAMENTREMMENFNAPEDQIDEQLAQLEEQDMNPTLKSQAIRYVSSLVIGAIMSLLIALFIRRKNQDAAAL
jgi:hypothetical protein